MLAEKEYDSNRTLKSKHTKYNKLENKIFKTQNITITANFQHFNKVLQR